MTSSFFFHFTPPTTFQLPSSQTNMQSPSPPLFISPEPSSSHHKQSSSFANPQHSTTAFFTAAPQRHAATPSNMRPRPASETDSGAEPPAKRRRRDSTSSRHSPRRDGPSRFQIIDLLDNEPSRSRRTQPASRPENIETIDLSTPPHPQPRPQNIPQGSRNQPIEIEEEEDDTPRAGTSGGVTLPPISSILGRLQQQTQEVLPEKPTDKNISFKNMTCVICMDKPTDLTAASCGMCIHENRDGLVANLVF